MVAKEEDINPRICFRYYQDRKILPQSKRRSTMMLSPMWDNVNRARVIWGRPVTFQ